MNKESTLIVRMDEAEKDSLKNTAKSYGMSVSDFVRMCLKLGEIKLLELDSQSKVMAKAKALSELK